MKHKSSQAFTLIELLIVVAIIAILAAIAVPNFLEAQVRSKVSRVKADQRSIATAIESYYVDNNRYPPDHNYAATAGLSAPFPVNHWFTDGLGVLTTPIAYMSSLNINDPFFDNSQTAAANNPGQAFEKVSGFYYMNYGYGRATPPYNWGGVPPVVSGVNGAAGHTVLPNAGWILKSFGPDRKNSGAEWTVAGMGVTAAGTDGANRIYDPTNGTISDGDIVRFGGSVIPDGFSQ